jgi:predicted DNA-binding protein
MSTQVTISLPDETYQRAKYLATLTGRDITEVLAETIQLSLEPLGTAHATGPAVAELADAEVLEIADSHMDPNQAERLSTLLASQQAGTLTHEGREDLTVLFQVYQEGMLRKARALHEAVARGLRPLLTP